MVKDALGLFLGSGQCPDRHDSHTRGYVHLGLEGFFDQLAGLFKVYAAFCLGSDQDHVLIDLIVVCDIDVVLAGYAVNLAEQFLYLTREHIYAVYFEHIVASAADDIQARMLGSAGAFTRDDAGEVVGTEADERSAFLDQGGDNDLTLFTVFYRFTGNRIDDLDVQIIIPVMHTGLFVLYLQLMPMPGP